MRLIDAESLKVNFEANTPVAFQDMIPGIHYIIDRARTIEAEPRWIPVEERLPSEKGEYLVTYHPCYWDSVEPEIKVGIDFYRGRTTWAKKKYQRVVAWMPLPKPYERKKE